MANQEPIIARAGEGAVHKTPFGDRLRWLAGEAETVGGYSLHDRLAPPGSRSTPHTHRGVTEAFYVIEGELELRIDDEQLMGKAGTFVLVPPNVTHAWRNTSDRDTHVLVLFTPPVAYEYFEELDRITTSVDRVDPSAVAALAEQYGLD